MHNQNRVREFHETFGHTSNTRPQPLSAKEVRLRVNLITEELAELVEACGSGTLIDNVALRLRKAKETMERVPDHEIDGKQDIVEIGDALADLDYVVSGGGVSWGFDLEALGNEVHDSNMSKLGSDGKPILDANGKVQKGPSYHKPDIAGVIAAQLESPLKVAGTLHDQPEAEASISREPVSEPKSGGEIKDDNAKPAISAVSGPRVKGARTLKGRVAVDPAGLVSRAVSDRDAKFFEEEGQDSEPDSSRSLSEAEAQAVRDGTDDDFDLE